MRAIEIRDRSRFATHRRHAASQNSSLDAEPSTPMDPATFFSALLAIVVIDLILAGDNAIVIALAARSLPMALQKRAIVWGAVGAIGVRSLMTVMVVWLLHIPGLLLGGVLLLLWIAYRLLLPDDDGGESHARGAGYHKMGDADDRHRGCGDGPRQRPRRRRRRARQLPARRRRPRHQRANRRLGQHGGAQGRRSLPRGGRTSARASWSGPRSR